MKLAILIPSLDERAQLLERLITELDRQINLLPNPSDVSIFTNVDNHQKTTGQKRNELIADAVAAGASYIAFIDDDDLPGEYYINWGIHVVESGMDCGELWGQIYWSGVKGKPFHHIIDCVNPATGKLEWWEDDKFYYRTINHLNFQKLSIVKDIPFPEKNFGEDGVQSERMRDAGIFKTMFPIPEILYHYFVGQPKHQL